jgi:Ca-activated chloride channel family protein
MIKTTEIAAIFIALSVAACDPRISGGSKAKPAAGPREAAALQENREGQASAERQAYPTTPWLSRDQAQAASAAVRPPGDTYAAGGRSAAETPETSPSTAYKRDRQRRVPDTARTLNEPARQLPAVAAMALAQAIPDPAIRRASEPLDRERYGEIADNPVRRVAEHPVSTFSIDVDTGAYANVRRFLEHGRLPPRHAVRVEEMINYFVYDYPVPEDRQTPFSVTTRIAPAPWRTDRHLLHIGIKGYEVPAAALPPANLVFLVDVSGSMGSADKLDLLKQSLKLLSRRMRAEDRLSIVVYAGASGVVLEPVAGNRTAVIESAIDSLRAGGSTNGGAGIRLAYAKAREAFIDGGINRVILATDGDFNVGTVDFERLKDLVERERKTGVSLTTLGFGRGNYNEHLMEQLADAGNGNYGYIDSLKEANKVLVQQMAGTLNTIARDVKVQIEFNPRRVSEYRLIGYQNRLLRREDFNNDKVDAGDIGAGHTVTALYEIALAGSHSEYMDPLRYAPRTADKSPLTDEIAFLRMRYKAPQGDESRLLERFVTIGQVLSDIEAAGDEFRFAAAVAGFGQLLRGGRYTDSFDYGDVLALARDARAADPFGYRGEFLSLVNLAASLAHSPR